MRDESKRRDLLQTAFAVSVLVEPVESWGPIVTSGGATLAFDAFDEAVEVTIDPDVPQRGRAIAVRHPHDPERLIYLRRDETGWTAWCSPWGEGLNQDDESAAWSASRGMTLVLFPVVERDGRLLVCG